VSREPAYGLTWWIGLAVGGAVIFYGLFGLVRDAAATLPPSWALWLLAGLAIHDLVVIPAVFGVARLAGLVPAPWRGAVRAALVLTGVVVLVTVPGLLGYGRSSQPGNTSVLPNDYPVTLAVVVALIWAVALGSVAVRTFRARRDDAA
jgi:hypothetical protein